MHIEARDFMMRTKARFPAHFALGKRALDVGSLDVNGNNQHLFDASCIYEGIDLKEGTNVDHVGPVGDFCAGNAGAMYDTIVSTECLAYDADYVRSLRNIVRLLKAGGLFAFTCATTGRRFDRHDPDDDDDDDNNDDHSGTRTETTGYPNYVQPLTPEDVQKAVPLHLYFESYQFEVKDALGDLYFWGLRNARPYSEATAPYPVRSMLTMDEAHSRQGTINDKGPSCHRHTRQYHKFLDPFRHASDVRYLEIGTARGDSLRAARAHMPRAARIVGIDHTPFCKNVESPDDHIFVEIGSATHRTFLESVVAKHGPFDIIIDDGSHVVEEVIAAFEVLFPTLKDGGVYIVENTNVINNVAHYRRTPDGPDHLSYFYRYLPGLNLWNASTPGYSGPFPCASDVDKVERCTGDPFVTGIDSVLYGVSFVAITKHVRRRWLPPGTPVPPAVSF